MTERITQCDVVDCCEDCPRYGDDCDGDKYLDRYPTMHEYAEGKRINPKLTDLISRVDAIEAVASITMSIHLSDVICDKLLALPSADAVPQIEHDREWIIGCIEHDGFIKTDRFDKANRIILDALSADAVSREFYEDAVKANIGLVIENRQLKEQIESADAVQGEWIMHIDDLFPEESTQECSNCHEHETIKIRNENYCPNCGARMKGGAE